MCDLAAFIALHNSLVTTERTEIETCPVTRVGFGECHLLRGGLAIRQPPAEAFSNRDPLNWRRPPQRADFTGFSGKTRSRLCQASRRGRGPSSTQASLRGLPQQEHRQGVDSLRLTPCISLAVGTSDLWNFPFDTGGEHVYTPIIFPEKEGPKMRFAPFVLPFPVATLMSAVAMLAASADIGAAQQRFEVTVAVANVRSEPNTSSRIVARVPGGTVLDVQGTEENWVNVIVFDESGAQQQGFIRSDLGKLEVVEPVVPPQVEPSPAVEAPPAPDPPVQAESASPSPAPPAANILEQRQWLDALDRTNQRSRRAKWMMVIGGGTFALGLAVRAKEQETGYQYVTDYGFGTAGALYAIGAGLAGWGVFELVRAQGERSTLEAEGRQKGFMVSVTPTAIAFSYRVTF